MRLGSGSPGGGMGSNGGGGGDSGVGVGGGAGSRGIMAFSGFRMEGRVTTACLWHACRAVTIGTLLIGMGITMIILGEFCINQTFRHFTMKPGQTIGTNKSSICYTGQDYSG